MYNMLIDDDIYYLYGKEGKGRVMALAFGLDGVIVHTMPTFTFFYDMINSSNNIVCVNDDCSLVNFLDDNENIIETLQTNSKLGSILTSSPKIFELMRRNEDNTPIEASTIPPKNREVIEGWRYNENGLIAPYGWEPKPVKTLAEIRQEFFERSNNVRR